jgi:hypothetical protein
LRQAYDYWQDQPGNFFVSEQETPERETTDAHTEVAEATRRDLNTKKCKEQNEPTRWIGVRRYCFGFPVFSLGATFH